MRIRQHVRAGLACAALALAAAAGARATTAITVVPFSFGPTQDSFPAFDPALGTLRSVHFELSGQFEPLILSDAAPYQGYAETVYITLRWFDGFPGHGFYTSEPSTLYGVGLTNAPGTPETVIAPFQDSFTFDALSDQTGFTTDSTQAVLSGPLADFYAGGPSGDQIIEMPSYLVYALGADGSVRPSLDTFIFGGGAVTYEYTPAPSPAPEPSTWFLMLFGIGLCGALARRTSRARLRLSAVSGR